MSCIETRKRIDELLDGGLSSSVERELREHLRDCPSCARHERALHGLVEEAAALPQAIDPPQDLWRGIERRIDALERGDVDVASHHGWSWRQALVAASLFVIGITAGYFLWREDDSAQTVRETAVAPAAEAPAELASRPAASGVGEAEQAFLAAKQSLRAVLAERRSNLSPATAAMIDSNLEIIEEAIAEITRALDENPGNPELNHLLMAQYKREIDFLQRVTRQAARL